MSEAIEFDHSRSAGFNTDGIPKRPRNPYCYSEGWERVTSALGDLIHNHIMCGGAWSQSVFTDGKRKGSNVETVQLLVAEYDLKKKVLDDCSEVIDWKASRAACPPIDTIKAMGEEGLISAAHISQSGDPSTGIFSGRIIGLISAPLEDPDKYKAASEVFHRDIEERTGLTIGDRCGTDRARWWAGTNNPEALIYFNEDQVVYDTKELLERAEAEVIAKEPFKYRAQSNDTPAEPTSFSKSTMRVLKYIFDEVLDPPDAESHATIVNPAKALARLVSPALDNEFCAWLSTSEYRLRKIGGSPERFLYSGDQFNNAGIGWFIRRVDDLHPHWREEFKENFGYNPGLNNFNPRYRRNTGSDF